MTNKEILINIMFAGSFTTNNIGHEIINLYKADNGKFYILFLISNYFNKPNGFKIPTIPSAATSFTTLPSSLK